MIEVQKVGPDAPRDGFHLGKRTTEGRDIEFTAPITRARRTSKVVEIRILGHWITLRGHGNDLKILANIYRVFHGRSNVEMRELENFVLHGKLVATEEWSSLVEASPAGLEWIEPGPTLLRAASMAFFGKPISSFQGRHPSVLRAARGAVCADCGAAAEEAHHDVPLALGGEDDTDNIVPLCRSCHKARHRRLGPIALKGGFYVGEVTAIAESLIWDVVNISIVGGGVGGRMYTVRWPKSLDPATRDAVYRIYLAKAPDGKLAVRDAELVK